MLEDFKLGANYLSEAVIAPTGDDTEQTGPWIELTNFGSIGVGVKITTAGATGLKALKFTMSDKDDGSGEQVDVLVKTIATADPGLIDAVGDKVWLEISSKNAAQALLDAEKTDLGIKYIAVKYTLDTGAEAGISLLAGAARYSGDIMKDVIAP